MHYRGKNMIDHDFYCTQCGNKGIPVCRNGRMREAGHLKKLYCMNCGSETNHAECITGSRYSAKEFQEEFEGGNFNSEGTRKVSLSEWMIKVHSSDFVDDNFDDTSIEEWMNIFGCT